MMSPVIVGGNGHSGTRVFAEILIECGIHMGLPGLSYARSSKDLNIRGLMSTWMKPYLLGLSDAQTVKMRRQFERRLRLLIPFRSRPWGFKNPRAMFLLPFYHNLFPSMKFIHVIRDGRDICLGNPFVSSPTYWSYVSEDEMQRLTPEEAMMRFWGEANRRTKAYGESRLGSAYLRIRFEDICDNPETEIRKILTLIDAPVRRLPQLVPLVKKPSSIGRWKHHEPRLVSKIISLGNEYLSEFGYQ